MGTYLDKTGLTKVWEKVKAHDTSTLTAAKNYTDELQTKLTDGTIVAKKASHASTATCDKDGNVIGDFYLKKTDSVDINKITVDSIDTPNIGEGQYQGVTDFFLGIDGEIGAIYADIKAITDSKGAANGIAPLNGSGKISTSYLPDSILGQVSYMGLFDASTSKATLSAGTVAQAETTRTLPTLSQIRVGNLDTSTYYTPTTGDYFIVNNAGTFDSIALNVGDWLIFNGGSAGWGKVDNTDAVSSVAGYTGAVTATQLATALKLSTTYATKDEVSNLEDTLQSSAEAYTDDSISALENTYLPANYAAKSHTHNYAGSSSEGGAATSANKVNKSLIIKFNGGAVEGTTLFTFDGSAAKTVNITPSSIGASADGHDHTQYPTKTEVSDGFATKNHTHSEYATTTSVSNLQQGIESGDIIAYEAGKVTKSLTFNNSGSGAASGTTFNGSTARTISYNTIGAAASSHTHSEYALKTELPSALTEADINEVCV